MAAIFERGGALVARKRKPGLTAKRHREVGAELLAIRNRLVTLSVEVMNAYPVASPVSRAADRVCTSVDTLRCKLDSLVYAESPGVSGMSKVYYGGDRP